VGEERIRDIIDGSHIARPTLSGHDSQELKVSRELFGMGVSRERVEPNSMVGDFLRRFMEK
jgi:hypothetical protein